MTLNKNIALNKNGMQATIKHTGFRRLRGAGLGLAISALLSACDGSGSDPLPLVPTPNDDEENPPVQATDFEAQASDFECIKNWPKVRLFFITNKLGEDKLEEALTLANNPVAGKQYPVGTIIQLIPTEAMVKRAEGFDPDNNNWEYFELNNSEDGTEITVRGTTNAANSAQGLQCLGCHDKAKEFDYICEDNHGCDDLGPFVNDITIAFAQATDPRC
jgi:hypothetical protein